MQSSARGWRSTMMLRTALVGTGYWGPNLANAIERTGKAVVEWLCDANPKNLSALARRYPHAKATTDIGEIMHDARVHALLIVNPTANHYVPGRQALVNRAHVH